MDSLRATFTQKLGPLPVWGWAALILAAALGYMYWKKVGIFAPGSSASSGTPGAGQGALPGVYGGVGTVGGATGGQPVGGEGTGLTGPYPTINTTYPTVVGGEVSNDPGGSSSSATNFPGLSPQPSSTPSSGALSGLYLPSSQDSQLSGSNR